jgi:tetratricopeptide (TPR) repeat protein
MNKRFSQASLWERQLQYYESKGMEAWQSGEVPYYITSNPKIAHAYAHMIHGLLRDRAWMRPGENQPVYVVELGAGTGRLAFHVLRRLEELRRQERGPLPSYRYIMSDVSERNIEYWRAHPKLAPLIEQGVLDVCRFDANRDEELMLIESGETISKKDLAHPVVVIANYFFDTIPQDLFYISEGSLYECGVVEEESAEQEELKLEYRLIPDGNYEQSGYNRLLEQYRTSLQSTHVLFPSIALDCLERLRAMTKESELVLLSADKGTPHLEELDGEAAPALVAHGSGFSLSVNYHAIFSYYRNLGGEARYSAYHHNSLYLSAVLALSEPAAYKEVQAAYTMSVEQSSPGDFYQLKLCFWEQAERMQIRELLAWLRLSGFDANFVWKASDRLLQLLPEAGDSEKIELGEVLQRVWEEFYSIDDPQDLAFTFGTLFYSLDRYEAALASFRESLRVDPTVHSTYYNMGLCYYELDQREEAKTSFRQALELYPAHEGSHRLYSKLIQDEEAVIHETTMG